MAAVVELAAYVGGVAAAVRATYGARCLMLKYNYLVMSLLLSSFGKLFAVLMMVWDYDLSFFALLNLFVLSSNVVALRAFLDTDALHAASFVSVGVCAKMAAVVALYVVAPPLGLAIL